MWTSNQLFGFKQSSLIEHTTHIIDWDGPSHVKVLKHTPSEIHVARIDRNGNILSGEEHQLILTKGQDPEFDQIARERQNTDDHEAWREKRSNALRGRHYHE